MTTNLFVIANVKQLRTQVILEFYCLFQASWGVGVLNSEIFNTFHNWVKFDTILEGVFGISGGGFEPPKPPLGTPLMEIFTISSSDLHAIIYLSNFVAVTNFQTTNITKQIYCLKHFMVSLYTSVIRNLHQQIL